MTAVVPAFRMVEFPAQLFNQGLGFEDIPFWAASAFVVMSALVAGIYEETGFRGHM